MRRRFIRLIAIIAIIIIVFLSIGVLMPANAKPAPKQANVGLNARVYLTQTTLQQLFQNSVDQQLPQIKKNALKSLSSSLPAWAEPFANSLIQPSVSVTALTPQQRGLRADLKVSLYQGDPQPINVAMLVTFQIKDSNTVQVNGQSIPGQPTLISGPLTTISLPIGQLNSINTTPGCGQASLIVGLQLPVSLADSTTHNTAIAQNTTHQIVAAAADKGSTQQYFIPLSQNTQRQQSTDVALQTQKIPQNALPASVEVPASSLSALASGIGTVQINNSLQAQNLRLGVQNGQYVATADIIGNLFGKPTLKLGTATTTIVPTAVNGQLHMNVQNTSVHILFLTLPVNTYNQQIEQALNNKIGGALNGRVTVNSVAVGPTAQIPCAAADSLLLSGSANIP